MKGERKKAGGWCEFGVRKRGGDKRRGRWGVQEWRHKKSTNANSAPKIGEKSEASNERIKNGKE